MKSVLKIFITVTLVLTMILSLASCSISDYISSILDSGSENDGFNDENNGTDKEDEKDNTPENNESESDGTDKDNESGSVNNGNGDNNSPGTDNGGNSEAPDGDENTDDNEGTKPDDGNGGNNNNNSDNDNDDTDDSGNTDTDGDNNDDNINDGGNTDSGNEDDQKPEGGTGNDNEGESGKDEEDDTATEETPYPEYLELPHYDYSDSTLGKYNSDLFYANDYDIGLGDPTVFYQEESDGGWFYVTGTTNGKSIELWRTKNFTDWSYLGKIYTPASNFFGVESFWAPQLLFDENADWKYYLGNDAGTGKGLYLLFFSAKAADGTFRLTVTFSKSINGPFTHFSGVNANGDYIDASVSCFDVNQLKGLGLYSGHSYGDLYKARRGFIDASPYVDPVTGDKYLYMVRNRTVDTSNDVWGVKMKDWVSPEYTTTTPLTTYGYTTINKTEALNFTTKNKIDEGPFLYYKDNTDDGIDNGKYYLTFSIGDTNDKLYPVCQAVGDSPLGPFTKLQPDEGGFIITPGDLWDIHGSGHHCFFEADGELFIAYHTYTINSDTTFNKRYFGMAKVEWIYNEDGVYIMRANGPSKDIQPLPNAASEYENIIGDAECNVTSGSSYKNTASLTDGLITLRENDGSVEFEFKGTAKIAFTFDEYVTARAIMIYNSYDYEYCFDNIAKIEFTYRKLIEGKYYYGTAYIEDLGFDIEYHLIPQYYLLGKGETNMLQLRPTGAAIAEFDELEIISVTVSIEAKDPSSVCRISEIMLLGTNAPADIQNVTTTDPFLDYLDFGTVPPIDKEPVKIDGILDEEVWLESKNAIFIEGTATDSTTSKPVDEKYGERNATVYTHIDDNYVYFAFKVTDKNLFYHSWKPQGRSTAVELYIAPTEQTALASGCYSIRINPIADGTFRLGVFVPNAAGNEWESLTLTDKIRVGVKVNGKVQTSADETDRNANEGYVIEIAIDKSLIGYRADSFRFTAAFVQMKEYDQNRMGNSFIAGTHYTKVSTWKVITNDGVEEE